MNKKLKITGLVALLILVAVFSQALTKKQALLQVLFSTLYQSHYKFKPLDNTYSKEIYDAYIKKLDPSKRFFTKEDLEEFSAYQYSIDEQLKAGEYTFYEIVTERFLERVGDVEKFIPAFFAPPINFSLEESLELDPKKRDYASNKTELEKVWRKFIKQEVLNQYLNLLEAETGKKYPDLKESLKKEPVIAIPELEKKATTELRDRYKELFKRLKEETEQERQNAFLDVLASVHDGHSNYFPPEEKEDFDIAISGKLEGIGAVLGEKDGVIKVISIVPGSVSSKQGVLKPEDIILKATQEDGSEKELMGLKVKDAVKYIRGKKGTKVTLTIKKPNGKVLQITLVRDVVVIEETYAKAILIKQKQSADWVGYIILPKFYRDFEDNKARNTTDDMRKLLEKLKASGAKGVIVDLRQNSGGALLDAVETAGLFIKTGPIVQVRDSQGNTAPLEDKDPSVTYDGPLVILVDTYSASASEILAAAMQDYGRAIIIGSDHTYGKGTVQTIIDLNKHFPAQAALFRPLGSLKVTIQKFYRVNGGSTQYKGVEPDIVLSNETKELEIGEKYMDYSLGWDTIKKESYEPCCLSEKDIQTVTQKSKLRMGSEQKFQELKARYEEIGRRRKQTNMSLNLKEAMKERLEISDETDRFNKAWVTENVVFLEPKGESAPKEKDRLELYNNWKNSLAKDPYVYESLRVIDDLIELNR